MGIQWDTFFYYGMGSVQDENQQDVIQIVKQPSASMFYNRLYGCDCKYNYPISAVNQSLVAYSIASAVAARNQAVTDGTNGTRDRRVAASQNTIIVNDGKNGERDVSVLYFNYADISLPNTAPSNASVQVT